MNIKPVFDALFQGKGEIQRFLEQNSEVFPNLEDKRRLQLTRTKVFNERKLLRQKVEREFAKIRQ